VPIPVGAPRDRQKTLPHPLGFYKRWQNSHFQRAEATTIGHWTYVSPNPLTKPALYIEALGRAKVTDETDEEGELTRVVWPVSFRVVRRR
jgi:hypothetical protein